MRIRVSFTVGPVIDREVLDYDLEEGCLCLFGEDGSIHFFPLQHVTEIAIFPSTEGQEKGGTDETNDGDTRDAPLLSPAG